MSLEAKNVAAGLCAGFADEVGSDDVEVREQVPLGLPLNMTNDSKLNKMFFLHTRFLSMRP